MFKTLVQSIGSCEVSAQEITTENAVSDSQTTDVKTEDERKQFWAKLIQLGLFNFDGMFTDPKITEFIKDIQQTRFLKNRLPLGFDEGTVFNKITTIGRDKFVEDVKLMIPFAVERGNNLEKITTRCNDAGKSEIKRLKTKYGLVTKATSQKSITLDRVCLAFPMLTCKYMRVARKPVVDKQALLSVCSDYPQVMMHKAFGTVIPRTLSEECKKIIIDAHRLHQAHFCAIIGRGRDKSNKKPKDYIGS